MKVVTICGSIQFAKEMKKIAYELEVINGYCVIQCVYNEDEMDVNRKMYNNLVKAHYKKIDISDAIYVVNVGGYIGEQTQREIKYAKEKGREIIYFEKV